jgi:hypothetical protein
MNEKLYVGYAVAGMLVASPYLWGYVRQRQGRPVSQVEIRGAVRRVRRGIAGFSFLLAIVFLVMAALTGQLSKNSTAGARSTTSSNVGIAGESGR